MIIPTREELTDTLKRERISKRLIRDLRFVPEEITQPGERDFLAITVKSGAEGVLMYDERLVQFELQRRNPNASGRIEAIICDICATWQRGTASAVLTIRRSERRTSSYLVCGDLDCSLHVRDLTDASKLSRTQVREQISAENRIERLKRRLSDILEA